MLLEFHFSIWILFQVRKNIGEPSYVFSNAGVYYHKTFLDHSHDEILKLVDVNLLGNLWVSWISWYPSEAKTIWVIRLYLAIVIKDLL